MKQFIKQRINIILKKIGFQITSLKQSSSNYYINILEEHQKNPKLQNKIDSIVFSKDRAIQLHAFLESYIVMVRNLGTMFILYKTTSPEHSQSYQDLKKIFQNYDFIFIEETNFKNQLNDICKNSTAKLLGFFVDDMIFTQEISYDNILKYDPFIYIMCLSRGCDFDYSQVLDKPLPLPKFIKIDEDLYEFRWNYVDEFNDWTYPLGVSGYFYHRNEIISMFNLLDYKSPNSLEGAMQLFLPFYKVRKGLCMSKIACCCVPANIVQEECLNPITGHATIQELLDKWNNNLKIDISMFKDVGVKGTNMKYEYLSR